MIFPTKKRLRAGHVRSAPHPVFHQRVLGEQLSYTHTYSDVHPPDPTKHHPPWLQAIAAKIINGARRPKHTRCSTSSCRQPRTTPSQARTSNASAKMTPRKISHAPAGPPSGTLTMSSATAYGTPYTQARLSTAVLSTAFAPENPLYPFYLLLSTREGASRLLKFFDQTHALQVSKPESGPPIPMLPEPD
ncbi:hypothetical protein EDB92DRAFT_1381803 [Lactarius akahatsu]|uniref:Uncharacterized protein n=1 Tax=Lactarius akahatsu TaxID=416441 RepID=A0AAD4L3W6_9AGAM|nr:hypothetical protein EDB92DRAFT_1381803 [Lactarius akahatsu]